MKKRLVAAIALVLACVLFVNMPVETSAITSDSIQQKENQLKKAEEEKKNLQNALTDIKALKKKLEAQKNDLKKYVQELDAQLQTIQDNISALNVQIAQKEEEIRVTQAELDAAREQEASQYEAMVYRVRFMYEQGETSYLDMIFSGDSFGEVLSKIEYMEQILAYDKEQLEQYQMTCQYIALCEQELTMEKEILDTTRENVLAEEAAMEELIAQKEQTITEFESSIATKEQAIQEYEDEIKEQDEMMEAIEAAILEEKRRILAENGEVITYDGGQFKFPVASYTRVSSPYGMRMHPTLGVEKFHNGVDLASPTGTAIYAAYDGKVVAASYSSSMGNYVMIDHGSGLYTIYMHASKLYVSSGTLVVRGETIAAVGSTGRSTGPHLHFGVRLNGSYVNPWDYISE